MRKHVFFMDARGTIIFMGFGGICPRIFLQDYALRSCYWCSSTILRMVLD